MPTYPIVPTSITVHLGLPDSNAPNVTVPFTSYIKNVASHELYPTWPEAALRANIMAQISFALNRVYTEFYRSLHRAAGQRGAVVRRLLRRDTYPVQRPEPMGQRGSGGGRVHPL